mmetsp:Transcript_5171/g.14595  ORF Transcript_5171/g.14595 Transcript_5171/m.14595 type:complete len:328 (-) Transcript_5171:141-1124(-)
MPATLDASLTRPKLDATLVLEGGAEDPQEAQHQQPHCPLFALASLNTKTAPSAEVRWSQLLALSLAPDNEPVLTVGRHKDCGVMLKDPRVSVRHFEIAARRKGGAPGAMFYDCFLNDCSSNGTTINGNIVGKGNSKQLRSGDEICVLPTKRVGADEMIGFLFRNTTEHLSAPEEVRTLELEDLVLCPICMQAIYKCVALTPCSHNFCMACLSDWMCRKNECPVCRRPISAVMKNHPMDGVIEAFLEASPQWRRSDEELQEMDAADKLRLGASGKLVRETGTVGAAVAPAGANGPQRPRTAPPGSSTPNSPSGSRPVPTTGSQVCAVQ